MGLRMGTGRDFKIVRTVERLNQIIHQSRLTSRFVSLFYGELETDGTLIYVNAGLHPPIFLRADGSVRYLTEGGSVLGPLPDATYTRGYLTMEPGDVLLAFHRRPARVVPGGGGGAVSSSARRGWRRRCGRIGTLRRWRSSMLCSRLARRSRRGRRLATDMTVAVIKYPAS